MRVLATRAGGGSLGICAAGLPGWGGVQEKKAGGEEGCCFGEKTTCDCAEWGVAESDVVGAC